MSKFSDVLILFPISEGSFYNMSTMYLVVLKYLSAELSFYTGGIMNVSDVTLSIHSSFAWTHFDNLRCSKFVLIMPFDFI